MSGYNNQNLNNYGNPAGGPPPARPPQPQPMQGIPPYQGPRPPQPQPQGPRPAQYPPPGAQYPPPGAPPYPVGAYGPPPGVPAFRPRPSGPNPGVGIVKIIFGLIFAVVGVGVLMKEGHKGFGEAAPFGIFAGLGAAMVVAGGLNCARKKLGFLIWAGVVVVLSAAFTGAGPSLSDMHYEREEAQAFEECKQYPTTSSWKYQYFAEYKLPAKYWRNEARSEFAFADAKESCDSKDAAKIRKSLKRMNFLIAGQTNPPVGMFEYDQTEMVGATPVDRVKEGRALCVAALKTMYEAAAAKLKQPAAKPKEGEVKVDEKLRTAFIALLAELADAEDSIVYVEFTNATKLEKPTEPDDLKSHWEVKDPHVKAAKKAGGYKIIDPGDAFSPIYDKSRRRVCLDALREAFKAVFNADLLTLQALENGSDRKGKIVLEISSLIVRQPSHFKYSTNPGQPNETLIGMLFAISVDWTFKLFNRSGAGQYDTAETSDPGANISILPSKSDPEWAAYSILMDSAYYNYSRQIAGAFGLTPPPEKTVFSYTAAEE